MANEGLSFKIDVKALEVSIAKLQGVGAQLEKSIERLAMAAYNQAVSIVREKLRSSSNQTLFLNHLKFERTKDGTNNAYLIIIEKEAMFLEEGTVGYSMKETHLKGRNSVIIPFNHNKNQGDKMSQQQSTLFNEVKTALKANKIPLSKTITNQSGQPILSTATKPRAAAMISNVESSIKGKASGESVLNRLHVYQSSTVKNGKASISKTMLTFRTLSKDSKSPWKIPPKDGVKVLDQVYSWLQSNYERILAENLQNLQLNLDE